MKNDLDEMLGYPTHDPHGDPIPARDGSIPAATGIPLSTFKPGDKLLICRLSDQTPVQLDFLESIGLLPRAEVTVVATGRDHITLRVAGDNHEVQRSLADKVYADSFE